MDISIREHMIYGDYLLEIDSHHWENMSDDEIKEIRNQEEQNNRERLNREEIKRREEIEKENKDQYSKNVDYLDTDYGCADQRESEE